MSVLYFLVPVALILAGTGVAAFMWAVRHDQFDDVHTPAIRMLLDDEMNEHTMTSTEMETSEEDHPASDGQTS